MEKKEGKSEVAIARSVLDLGICFVSVVEAAGGTIEDAREIFKDNTLKERIGLLMVKKYDLGETPCQRFVPYLIPDRIKDVVWDVEPTKFDPKKLKFSRFLRDSDGGRVKGQTMRQRARGMKANLGLSDVPALLGKDGKGWVTIPAELRGKIYIVLTGTVLRDYDGDLRVPFIYWDVWQNEYHPDGWVLGFGWFDRSWNERARLVSCDEAA